MHITQLILHPAFRTIPRMSDPPTPVLRYKATNEREGQGEGYSGMKGMHVLLPERGGQGEGYWGVKGMHVLLPERGG